jgi:hypothetical protein
MPGSGELMGALQSLPVDEIVRRGSIKDIDVRNFRAATYKYGVTADDAEILFRANESCPIQDPSWARFFIAAISDYLINRVEPEGYLTAEKGAWLIARLSRSEWVRTKTEIELLLEVLEKSRWSPASLVRFALSQVSHAVFDGSGPLRGGQMRETGCIREHEVEFIRRVVYAFGGDGCVGITRAEAEVLFDIDGALSQYAAIPAWTDFFVKAILNVVMASAGYAVPPRELALQRDPAIPGDADLRGWAGAPLLSVATSSLDSVWDLYTEQSAEHRALARLERQRIEIITNEEITEGEADWLAARLGRDGRLTANQTALVVYLLRRSPNVPAVLGKRIAVLAAAA